MWSIRNSNILNCIAVSGSPTALSMLCDSLDELPDVCCHRGLLDKDHAVRRENHEKYFGESQKLVDWCDNYEISAEQYLANKVFDRALHNERVIIAGMLYTDIQDADLWEFIASRSRIGDFCLIHLERNPLACYADQQKFTYRIFSQLQEHSHKLKPYVHDHCRLRDKLNSICRDRVTFSFREFLLDYRRTCRRICRYLGLPQTPEYPAVPNITGRFVQRSLEIAEAVNSGRDLFDDRLSDPNLVSDLF